MTNATEQYIHAAANGQIVVSRFVRQTCQRHLEDLEHAQSRGLMFSKSRADHVIRFIETFCRHSKGAWAGKPFVLDTWQTALVSILFGWVQKETGYRRFRFAYCELARGSGKSTLAAAIGLYMLLADGEPGAEVYAAATKKEQARIVWSEADRMVRQSPSLRKRIRNRRNLLDIKGSASKFEPLSSDIKSLDGLNPACCLVDELHAHPSRQIWDVLTTALGKRRQPLLFAITTAGYDRHSVCWEQHTYSQKVLEGSVKDDSWFAWIAGLDEGDNWEDEANWVKANPGLGSTVQLTELRGQAQKAKESPSALNSFLRLRLNVWTESVTAWLPMDKWKAASEPFGLDILKGRRCYAGLDLSTTTDISALVLLFPPTPEDTHYRVLPFFFIPKQNIEARVKRDRVPYDVWKRLGLLTCTDGNVIDYDVIRAKAQELGAEYDLREIVFDRWNASQLTTQLQTDGFTLVQFGQGFASMSAPTKRLLELVLSEKIAHSGNPILTWMAGNALVQLDAAGNIKLDKSRSTEKIDGMVALTMALSRAELDPNIPQTAGIFII
jgi:phage terminase large subunit-like protein